ncbi:MAG: sulfite exporter TauE/SafE family protein [Deltaproteobacteria bacterium]|nr:sulfite exporter TauE/SafE family protein [Deltaproteobacteria bacterium]
MKMLRQFLLYFFTFFLLTSSIAYAKTDLSGQFSPPLISDIAKYDFKKAETHILKNAKIKLKSKGLSKKEHAELLTLLLTIYKNSDDKSNLAKTLADIRGFSPDAVRADKTEAELETGLKLARLYNSAYSVRKEKIFKDRAIGLLKQIQNIYFDNKTNVFIVNVNGKPSATATANAAASTIFLEASKNLQEKPFEDIARDSIAYLKNNLIKGGGAFHIFDINTSSAFMDGQLIDNAMAGIALLEGYKNFKDETKLDAAKNIAEFMQKRLYDEKFGGFIQRNSNSQEYYSEGEELYIGDKPFEENAIAGYFFESIYEITGDARHSDAVKGTLGYLAPLYKDISPEKQAYFLTTANNYIKSIAAAKKEPRTEKLGWETELPKTGLLPLAILSFLAGILSFLSPCTLPILPAYFAFAFQGEKRRIMAMTFFFFLGLALVFSIMGATASFIGSFLKTNISIITTVGGILIIIFGFMSLIGKGFSGARIFQKSPSATLGGSFIFGAAMAFGWTACVGPILAGILVLAATEEKVLRGVGLLFIYALGLGLPLMIISLFFKNMNRDSIFWRFLKGKGWEVNIFGRTLLLHSTSIISGIIFISLGVLMVSGYLAYINKIIPLSTQVWFADIEDKLMEMFK